MDNPPFAPRPRLSTVPSAESLLLETTPRDVRLPQAQTASRMAVTRAAYAQMESQTARLRLATLKKIAAALGVEWEQVRG